MKFKYFLPHLINSELVKSTTITIKERQPQTQIEIIEKLEVFFKSNHTINKYNNQMGCNTCKISQVDTDFFKTCKTNKTFVLDFQPLLTSSQRNFWINQLQIPHIPETDFWTQFNGFHHSCFNQIAKDINRTFPTLPFFSNKSHITRFQLLLKKFAIYFPKIGYTQGLNFIAGYLLMCGFDDESAFKVLVSLMVHEKIMAIGLYQDEFLLNRFYCEVFWKLMEMKLPKLAQKIKKAKVQDQIWIFQWFISMFLYSFPTEYVKRFWDFIILKKELSIVLIALGIVRCLKNDILSLKNPDEFQFLQLFENTKDYEFCKNKLDSKKLINFINSITPQQIQKAVQQTSCMNNFYRRYFTSVSNQRSQLYIKTIKTFKYERTSFKANPDPRKYTRAVDATNQLENLMLSKYKLYQSEYKRSNVASSIFKMSTFSIAVDDLRDPGDMNKKSSSAIFNNPFLNKINFAQSKVLQPGFDFSKFTKMQPFTSPPKKVGVNPFEEIAQRTGSPYETNSSKSPQLMTPTMMQNGKKEKLPSKEYGDFTKKPKPYSYY